MALPAVRLPELPVCVFHGRCRPKALHLITEQLFRVPGEVRWLGVRRGC